MTGKYTSDAACTSAYSSRQMGFPEAKDMRPDDESATCAHDKSISRSVRPFRAGRTQGMN